MLAGRGDSRALATLWERHQAHLRGVVRRRLGASLREHVESGDVLQEAFLEALRDYSVASTANAAFLPWIVRVIEHTIRDRARFFGRQRRAADREVALGSEVAASSARDPTPSAVVRGKEVGSRLECALAQLRAEDRQLIEWSRLDGKSAREIAQLLGKTEAAAQRATSRAVARLAALLSARKPR